MDFATIKSKILTYRTEGKKMFTTSSFQTHSLVLLHMISRIDKTIPVYFVNTGYHFPETIAFRDMVSKLFGLQTVNLKPLTPKNMQKDSEGKLLFTSDPDYCCFLNKTQPLDQILMQHDIWINGVRADQSAARKAMKEEQSAPHNVMRFHPMLDWTNKTIYQYIKIHQLPKHPLESKSYFSIGCEPCTRKMDPDMQEREARWYGMNKSECGLHTDLIHK